MSSLKIPQQLEVAEIGSQSCCPGQIIQKQNVPKGCVVHYFGWNLYRGGKPDTNVCWSVRYEAFSLKVEGGRIKHVLLNFHNTNHRLHHQSTHQPTFYKQCKEYYSGHYPFFCCSCVYSYCFFSSISSSIFTFFCCYFCYFFLFFFFSFSSCCCCTSSSSCPSSSLLLLLLLLLNLHHHYHQRLIHFWH